MIPYRSVHFIGVLTPEMASLAAYSLKLSLKVSGSDDHSDSVYLQPLEKAGMTFYDMFAQVNISKDVDLVVLSRYYDMRHIEADTAVRLKIPVISETDYAKLINQSNRRLAILGDYEARFIAALLSHVWQKGHVPVRSLTQTVPLGKDDDVLAFAHESDWFILPLPGFKRDASTYEADYLSFEAETVILPSIVYDYPELNVTLDDVYQSCYTFVKRIPRRGLIIGNGDYTRMKRLRRHLADRHIEMYGFDRDVTWQIHEVVVEQNKTVFSLVNDRQRYGPFIIPYVGKTFVYAAAAVCVASLSQDMNPETIAVGLASAPKYKRYFETTVDREGRIIIDDQADHPHIISDILETVRLLYPQKKIWCLYQAGSFLRTKALFQELQQALSLADFVYLADIKGYPKEKSEGLNIRHLVAKMKHDHPQTYYYDDTVNMTELLSSRVASTDCIITLGAEGLCQSITRPLITEIVQAG